MPNNKRNFIRGECENCGAPLSRAKQKGKYVCQYCGAVYYDNSYSGSNWEEDVETSNAPDNSLADPIFPPTQPAKRKNNLLKLIGFGLLAVICLIVFIVTSLAIGKEATSKNSDQSSKKPEMLATLPKAVKAGTSVAYANWELTINPEITVDDNRISFTLNLQNWNDTNQTFRYKPNTFLVYDDLGNKYPLYIGNCEPDTPYLDRQITFEPQEITKFQSSRSWCNRDDSLPEYSGVIPQEANELYFYLEDFGVYKNIIFVFEL